MLENVGRKITLILILLATSLVLLLLPDKPFNLGLDLQGGTRMVYSFDFDAAAEEGQIGQNEDRGRLLEDTIAIIRNRLDPTGTLEAVLRREGQERIVIELPGTLGLGGQTIESSLADELDDGSSTEIVLQAGNAARFPEAGGVVRIEGEEIRYRSRDGTRLLLQGEGRGHYGTTPALHEAGVKVELINDDAIRGAIENLGELSFAIVGNRGDLLDVEPRTDFTEEEERLRTWVEANPGTPLTDFNRLDYADGGPHPRVSWYPRKPLSETESLLSELDRRVMILRMDADSSFDGTDVATVFYTQDGYGYPAVGFEMKGPRKGDFGDFTGENINRQMAIILNGVVESDPNINSRLPGSGIIQGQYTDQQVRELITVLRSGSLKIKPTLEHEEKVGATLGADYVKRGLYSGVIALVAVLAFMMFYYRKLGVFSAISLLASFTMLMGGLSFLKATLTLPGIAGIILTVGMAVDANILIFDRIREEIDKGRNLKQAVTTGFEKALSAILDANITTLLTAIILYNVGTGPVRGFAVTLMIGIITSVFAALVITRVLVHFSLVRGAKSFPMGQLMVKANYDFLGKAKIAVTCSIVLVVTGLALFVMTPDKEKLGIDFTGGTECHFRTQEPQEIGLVRQRVASIEIFGDAAEIKPVLNSEKDGKFDEFRAVFKSLGATTESEGEKEFESILQRELSDILLAQPIRVSLTPSGAVANATIDLSFDETHPTNDIGERLAGAGLNDVTVSTISQTDYQASATTSAGRSETELIAAIEESYRDVVDSNGGVYTLAAAIPSTTRVGPQVVGELRDKALLALAVSLFAIVLYIRVRFAEYSYGWAAVAALTHDVLLTLGVLTIVNRLGLLNGEINLPMIAAFLTIIGYSLNDTIVIFDRVRENLPRMKKPLIEVLNTSINQTMSRTILTSVTTFLAVAILFGFNFGTGNVLETFSFAMMIGIITGTYSTIFIANPVLLWLENRRQAASQGSDERPKRRGELEAAKS